MLYVINYASAEPYESYRHINTITAKWLGKADAVIEFSSSDIPEGYRTAHMNIFKHQRGAGLWLWKPYIINRALSMVNDEDWIFYSDAGAIFIRDLHHLVEAANRSHQDVMLFEQPLLHRQFTKSETMDYMHVKDIGKNQTLGILLLKKTEKSIRLMKEWLCFCEIEEIISPEKFNLEIPEFEDFISHREDQSVLSTLRIKYSLPAFRDPSDYGEMPFLYCFKNVTYSPQVYTNSNYPTILLCSRNTNPIKYLFIYIIRKLFIKIGFYTGEKRIKNPPILPSKK